MNRAARAAGLAALLAVAVALPLAPWLTTGAPLGARDTARLYAPLRPLVVDALRSLRLPLWNPFEGTGHPLLAEGIHGVLHPVSVAMAWIAPTSMNAFLVAYLVVAALGAWVLARGLGRSPAAAFLAAVTYALSGFVASMTDNLVFLAGLSTLPWVIAGLRHAAQPGTTPIVAGGAAVAAALLAGDAQVTAVGVLLGCALAADAGGSRALARAAGAVVLGALLGAAQLVPSAAHLDRTVRKLPLDEATRATWALSPWRLLELAVPGLFGSREPALDAPVFRALGGSPTFTLPFASSVHVGLVALLLAARGARGDRTSRVLAAAALLLLWLAMGPRLGAAQALGWLPIWGKFRYAEKLAGPATLCLALLAARGLDRDLDGSRRSWVPLGTVGILAGLGALALLGTPVTSLLGGLGHPDAAPVALRAIRLGVAFAAPFALLAAAALAATRLPGRVRGWAVAASAWGLCAASLSWAVHPTPAGCAGPGWLATLDAPAPGPRIGTPTSREFHSSQPGAWSRTWCEFAALGVPAMNATAGVDQIDLYTGLDPIRFLRTWHALGDERWTRLRRFGLTHVIAGPPGDASDLRTLEGAAAGGAPVATPRESGLSAWSVPHRPWASFAPSAWSAPTPQPKLDRLLRLLEQGSDEVVVQAEATPPVAPGRVLAIRRGAEQVEIEAEAAGPALLVVNDAFWPGWTARVDGADVPVLPADVLVRAVPFPAGRHRLAMRYEPPEVAWGIGLSAVGAAVALGLLAIGRRRRAGPEGAA